MFKAGDRVLIVAKGNHYPVEGERVITQWIPDIDNFEVEGLSGGWTISLYNFTLISSLTNKQMGIKEAFVLALTSEPKKSFRKAGITNGDDLLTEDGQKIFLTWLLHTKHSDEFKTGVVDGLLADQK